MENTKSEWMDRSWSPWWGCTRVSPACKNCYAESMAKRFGHPVWGDDAGRRKLKDDHWKNPIRWNKKAEAVGERRQVFCAPMADVFEDRPDLVEERQRLWKLIEATPNLDWQLLTKRPQNVQRMVPWGDTWPANVWLGVTVENQQYANERLPLLVEIPAIVRFISAEPLLGPIDLSPWISQLSWVIIGGETGNRARPTSIEWVRPIRDLCTKNEVPFYFKHWGMFAPGSIVRIRRKKDAVRELDGRTWSERPTPDVDGWLKHPGRTVLPSSVEMLLQKPTG